jgi:hypothetical protein
MNQPLKIESDAFIKKSVYRGSVTYTVFWTSEGVPVKKDFAELEPAKKFLEQLSRAVESVKEDETSAAPPAPTAETNSLSEETKIYLGLLDSSPEELNALLKRLANAKKYTLRGYAEQAAAALKAHETLHELSTLQEMDVDAYLSKLRVIEAEPIDEIVQTYNRYTFSKQETKRLLVEYMREYQEKEDDEDEVHFIKIKLSKLLRAFDFDIFSINDNHIKSWFEEQKGSESAKERLLSIVNDFRTFANVNRIEMPSPFVQ